MANKSENLVIRPPVVVIMGHVDHGKTTILDYIRESKVAESESGGITQHIGAYQIEKDGKKITFLDTPGHEAFSALRSRGATVADIAVMVVAADEGIKPQTKEVIDILAKSEIPYVVAINKIDKDNADSRKIKSELAENNVLIEEWGGKIPAVEISAKTGQGIDGLLEMILLLAELEELKANEIGSAHGIIVESKMDSQKGTVATLLVKEGILKKGDIVVSGTSMGRVRTLEDFLSKQVSEAKPSSAVLTTGWNSAPQLGSKFEVVNSASDAKKIVGNNIDLTPPSLFVEATGGVNTNKKILKLIIKADVFSSLEAIDKSLQTIHSDEVGYSVISSGIGNISEGDMRALANEDGKVYGFRVGIENSAIAIAERSKSDIEYGTYDVIYELIEKIKKDLSALLDPEIKRNTLGKMKVLALFKKAETSQVVGGKVTSGKVKRGALADILRGSNDLVTGKIGQLQHNKVDVEEVKEGLECGIRFDGPAQIREGDVLEIYEEEKILRSI